MDGSSHYVVFNCTLAKSGRTVSIWIPGAFADVGRKLRYREDDIWTDGWEVISVGDSVPVGTILSAVVAECI